MYVYILQCADGSYYVGHTSDLFARLRTHNEGRGAKFTAARRPVAVAYAEHWPTEVAAIRREKQLKGWTRRKKVALIESTNPGWVDLAADWPTVEWR